MSRFALSASGRFAFAGVVAAVVVLPLLSCGSDLTNPREVYLAMRSAYQSGDYERMISDYMHERAQATLIQSRPDRADTNVEQMSADARLQAAESGLRRLLPSRSDLEQLVNDVVSVNPEATEGLEKNHLFYRLSTVHQYVHRKRRADLSPAELRIYELDVRFPLVFLIPSDELGRRINPEREAVNFNVPGGAVRFSITRNSRNEVRYMWPR